jgi:hypothetical protein
MRRIWPFLGHHKISKFSQGELPRIRLIVVLEDGITRGLKSNFALGPQISLGAVQCTLVLAFLNINCTLFCCYTFCKGVLLLGYTPIPNTKMCSDKKFLKLGMC